MRNVTILGSLSLLKYINRTDMIIINLFNNTVTLIEQVQKNECLSNFSVSNVNALLNIFCLRTKNNNNKNMLSTKFKRSITPSS